MPNRHFSPTKTFVDPERRIALLLNPKVMTTFLRRFLVDGLAEFRGLDDPSEGRYRLLGAARKFPVARLGVYREFLRSPQDYRTFAFVRNPYARIWSAWADKFRNGHDATPDGRTSGYPRSMRRGELRAARRFARRTGLPGSKAGEIVPLDTFVAYAAATPPGRRNQHWEQQCIVLQQPEIPLTDVVRIETGLEDGMHQLAAALGFSADWARSKLYERINTSATHGTVSAMTESAARTIRRAYSPDFDRFGYHEDDIPQLR